MSPMIAVLTLCAAFVAAEADAKEPAEITIHIRGEHKAVISALQVHFLPYRDATRGGLDTTRAELIVATLDSMAESRGNMSTGKRVGLKLIAGTVGGVMGAVIGASSGDGGQEIDFGPALYGYLAGIAIGVPMVDVSGVDPRDRSMLSLITSLGVSLGGSVVGVIGGGGLTLASQDALWPSILIGPVVGATLASELSRKPPQARRVSFALAPTLNGGLSAVAQLRF